MKLSIQRYLLGTLAGLVLIIVFWSYSAYFYVSVPLIQGILGSLVLLISCGAIAMIGSLDELIDSFPML